jgi:WD40 repeat protein
MEMLALDISRLPGWEGDAAATAPPSRRKVPYDNLISMSSHLDPKLRGFGAVVRLRNSPSCKYILACGRGIKNVHIWTFAPDAPQGPEWSFVYDVASNGNTIETLGFRDGGRQALSKSAGSIVRVWDLSSSTFETRAPSPASAATLSESGCKEATSDAISEYDTTEGPNTPIAQPVAGAAVSEPLDKLPYQDVPNSHDVRCFANNFAFGGTYEFVVVRPDAPGWANRCVAKSATKNIYIILYCSLYICAYLCHRAERCLNFLRDATKMTTDSAVRDRCVRSKTSLAPRMVRTCSFYSQMVECFTSARSFPEGPKVVVGSPAGHPRPWWSSRAWVGWKEITAHGPFGESGAEALSFSSRRTDMRMAKEILWFLFAL